ncbi:MAG TPA: formyltransferase family protein [Solirubrobacteraceae bacterium]|nr:formyltransferase family protein [Solirubrobacteraceae bacterium]
MLVSRYPRVDTPGWKRQVASELRDAGIEVEVLYSRSSLADQARAGLQEEGLGVFKRYLALRGGSPAAPTVAPGSAALAAAENAAQSLAGWAGEHGLAVHRYDRLGDDDALAAVRASAPDLLLLTGSDIAPASLLSIPRVATINAHYGLLPRYRGMNVTEWSLYHGDPPGVTVHIVDPGIDTGDILLREEIPCEPGATLESLRKLHQAAAARLLVTAALQLRDGTEQRTPQRADEGHQYYRMHRALRARVERDLAQRT